MSSLGYRENLGYLLSFIGNGKKPNNLLLLLGYRRIIIGYINNSGGKGMGERREGDKGTEGIKELKEMRTPPPPPTPHHHHHHIPHTNFMTQSWHLKKLNYS